jgi:hypothetical protein
MRSALDRTVIVDCRRQGSEANAILVPQEASTVQPSKDRLRPILFIEGV